MKDIHDKTPILNGLLASVQFDLAQPFFIAGLKALGLISKYITSPSWRAIEDKDISISMMNTKYLALMNYFEDCSMNMEDFIAGTLLLFDLPVKNDMVHEALIEKADIDCHVEVILSTLLPALSRLNQLQYGDHLPGEKHCELDFMETSSTDKHNKFPERVFSLVGNILSSRPNITTLVVESHVTFSLNRTAEWLANQDNASEIVKRRRKGRKKQIQTERGTNKGKTSQARMRLAKL